MDRGTWRATVRGVARVKQNLATKQQQKQPALYRKRNSYSLIAHMRLQPKYKNNQHYIAKGTVTL